MTGRKISRPKFRLTDHGFTKRDESIIGTNDYSIVSKRSVEKLYYSHDEPEFLRPFVSKFKRRSPLINRGYWLRMRAVEDVVTKFVCARDDGGRRKVVVNVGCGYDVLPFRTYHLCPDDCRDVNFVDVDYPQLIEKKVKILQQNAVFEEFFNATNSGSAGESQHLSPQSDRTNSESIFRRGNYVAIGCDLGHLEKFEKLMAAAFDTQNSSVLFIAEVSITYMPVEKADALIRLASTLPNACFCLLEQHLPDRDDHPFARTMLDHFAKQTPLQSIHKYPTLVDQRSRFRSKGWAHVEIRDLWDLWQDLEFLSYEERQALDAVEPFDEWEELALFAGHYFLLVARNPEPDRQEGIHRTFDGEQRAITGDPDSSHIMWHPPSMATRENPKGQGLRRFGAMYTQCDTCPSKNPKSQVRRVGAMDTERDTCVVNHGGISSIRGRTEDTFRDSEACSSKDSLDKCPVDVMCHTITDLPCGGQLFVGGRTSPEKVDSRCWHRAENGWRQVDDLHPARYRHCATAVSDEAVLVFGGKTSEGQALNDWNLWMPHEGWRKVSVTGDMPSARFGASMTTWQENGFLLGGMSEGGIVLEDVYEWRLDTEEASLHCQERAQNFKRSGPSFHAMARFGSALIESSFGILLIGGISKGHVLRAHEEIILLNETISGHTYDYSVRYLTEGRIHRPLPLLVGFSAARVHDRIFIAGGGAVCFSFGAFWNENCYTLKPPGYYVGNERPWELATTICNQTRQNGTAQEDGLAAQKAVRSPVKTLVISTAEQFRNIIEVAEPTIITGQDIGCCSSQWSLEYLRDRIGGKRQVTIHRSSTSNLSFNTKNFDYSKVSIDNFLDCVSRGEHVYLRALSESSFKTAANLWEDFPALAEDFHIPPQLIAVNDNLHSSVLRMSGDINMWLHYDVMANIYCQIRGRKRFVIFPPADVLALQYPPGATTSPLDVFEQNDDDKLRLQGATALECTLNPGDVLFLPPCWSHATSPAGDGDPSIAVNVFFYTTQRGLAAGKDVWGNKDPDAYTNGRKAIARLCEKWKELDTPEAILQLSTMATDLLKSAKAHRWSQGPDWLKLEAFRQPSRRGRSAGTEVYAEAQKIRRGLRDLPESMRRFYLERLGVEIRDSAIELEKTL